MEGRIYHIRTKSFLLYLINGFFLNAGIDFRFCQRKDDDENDDDGNDDDDEDDDHDGDVNDNDNHYVREKTNATVVMTISSMIAKKKLKEKKKRNTPKAGG